MSTIVSIAPKYRELLAITGELRTGDAIFGQYELTCDAKIDVRSRSGNILMQLLLDAQRKIGSVSQYSEGQWNKLAQMPIASSGSVTLNAISPSLLAISFGEARAADVNLEVTDIVRLHGAGDWQTLERQSGATLDADSLLIRDLAKIEPRQEFAKRDGLVFDIGFYDGSDTAYYLWRGYDVVAVEANPVLAARGAEYFHDFISSRRLHIVNCAIGDSEGVLPFFVNRVRPEWSSTNRGTASRGLDVEEIAIATIKPAALFATFGVPHFVKIDIEGQDISVIEALRNLEAKPQYVSFEVNPSAAFSGLRQLSDAGYRRFNIVDQSKVHMTLDHRVFPEETGLAGPAAFRFRRGASGTFGERLGGPWLDRASTETWLRGFLDRHAARNADFGKTNKITFGDWFDIHATL
jgi:FkbM family methyltransferase